MKRKKRIAMQTNLLPEMREVVVDLQRRELRTSSAAMIELLIYEALVARGEIVPIQ